MTQSAESFVPVKDASNATQNIRNLKITLLQADGTYATVQVQAVSIVDQDGLRIDMAGNETNLLLKMLIREVQALRKIMGRATGQLWVAVDAMGDDI